MRLQKRRGRHPAKEERGGGKGRRRRGTGRHRRRSGGGCRCGSRSRRSCSRSGGRLLLAAGLFRAALCGRALVRRVRLAVRRLVLRGVLGCVGSGCVHMSGRWRRRRRSRRGGRHRERGRVVGHSERRVRAGRGPFTATAATAPTLRRAPPRRLLQRHKQVSARATTSAQRAAKREQGGEGRGDPRRWRRNQHRTGGAS